MGGRHVWVLFEKCEETKDCVHWMEGLIIVCPQAGLIQYPPASNQHIQYPVYLGFGVSGNSFLVIWSIITNLGPHPFPKGLKQ